MVYYVLMLSAITGFSVRSELKVAKAASGVKVYFFKPGRKRSETRVCLHTLFRWTPSRSYSNNNHGDSVTSLRVWNAVATSGL